MRATASRPHGVTLLETMLALCVLLIALVGLAQLQVVSVRMNHLGRSTSLATMLSRDLVESMSLWSYQDPRLAPLEIVRTLDDDPVRRRLDPGQAESLTSDARMQFAERTSDANASTTDALGAYQGVRSDLDGDGTPDFSRYWTVFGLDEDGDGREELKFVVVAVRWKEPGWGMRNVVATTVRHSAARGLLP